MATDWDIEIITKTGNTKNWDALTIANWEEIEDTGFYFSSPNSWTFSGKATSRDSD
jgi:hypothetical protein